MPPLSRFTRLALLAEHASRLRLRIEGGSVVGSRVQLCVAYDPGVEWVWVNRGTYERGELVGMRGVFCVRPLAGGRGGG